MSKVLVISQVESDGTLAKPGLEALAKGIELSGALAGSSLVVGLFGASVEKAANQISSSPAASYLGVQGAEFAQARYATDALAIQELVRNVEPAFIIAAGTSRIMRAISGAAARVKEQSTLTFLIS